MNFSLKDRTILLCVAGSRAYGLNTPESDLDLKGVCVATREYFLGNSKFEQADKPSHFSVFKEVLKDDEVLNPKIEGTVYEIRKMLQLATKLNANIFDILFCRDEEVRICKPAGKLLRDNRNLFLSKNMRWSLSGYALDQLHKMKLHRDYLLNPIKEQPKRSDFNLPEKPELPKNKYDAIISEINRKLDLLKVNLDCLELGDQIYVREQVKKVMVEYEMAKNAKIELVAGSIGLNDNLVEIILKERDFRSATENWHKYNEWKNNRNPKRAVLEEKYGYDCKHAVHLLRLYTMAAELFEKEQFNVYRQDDKEYLMNVRNGKFSYEEIIEQANALEKRVAEAYPKSTLPKSPDQNKVNKLCIEIVESML